MLHKSRLILFLVVISMLLGLSAGCNNNASEPSAPIVSAPASASPSDTDKEDQPAETEAPDDEQLFKLPIVDTKVTFELWGAPYSVTAGMQTGGDSKAYQEAEKRTNIHIEFSHPAEGQASEQFNLIVASENYPDSFMTGNYIGGLDRFISDNIIIDLRPYLEEHGPNFMAMAKIDERTWKYNLTDEGHIPGFYNISYEIEPSWLGPATRLDWLTDLGLKAPVTISDWYNMLKAYKEQKGATNPYMFRGPNGRDDALMVAYGIVSAWFVDNNKIKFGPAEQAYGDYLREMRTWYAEGLIDPDFFSRGAWTYFGETTPFITTGQAGAWASLWTYIDVHTSQAKDPNFQSVAIAPPVLKEGDKREMTMYGIPDSRVGGAVNTISSQCSDPATLVKWFDYFYSDEGALLANYGIEGETFAYDSNGKPYFLEIVAKNPDNLSLNDAMILYTIGSGHSRQYAWDRQITPSMSEYAKSAGATWDMNWTNTKTLPRVTLTSEESAEYTSIYNDLDTFITEFSVAYIVGDKPEDSIAEFQERLSSMNLGRCIEIYQAALDRYNKR